MKNFLLEFKTFAVRGNVVDLAVGIIIGGAFGKIVSALVENIFMPPIGLLLGGVDFRELTLTLKAAGESSAAVTLKYGLFLQAVIDFVIVAFAIFLLIKGLNSLKKKEDSQPAPPPEEIQLLTEIRNLLKK